MTVSRRSFLASILAAGVAPAFAGSGVLMPVKKIIVPRNAWVELHHLYAASAQEPLPAQWNPHPLSAYSTEGRQMSNAHAVAGYVTGGLTDAQMEKMHIAIGEYRRDAARRAKRPGHSAGQPIPMPFGGTMWLLNGPLPH